jgi:hypothetical protein
VEYRIHRLETQADLSRFQVNVEKALAAEEAPPW